MSEGWLKLLLAEPWLLPDKVMAYILNGLSRSIVWDTTTFGWLQAILCSPSMDQWQRYASVIEEIKKLDKRHLSILDVGGGGDIIRSFLAAKENDVHILDTHAKCLRRVKDRWIKVILGDGCALPFKDDSFDVVISLDSLEHVPDSTKLDYCRELKRAAKSYVIIHCPVDSTDGRFQGTSYDIKFLRWYRRRYKKSEPNTAAHLRSGLPKLEQLAAAFPNAKVIGRQNCELWLTYMKGEYTPYARLAIGLFYKAFLSRKDSQPPYKSCLLVWRKG